MDSSFSDWNEVRDKNISFYEIKQKGKCYYDEYYLSIYGVAKHCCKIKL